MKKSIVISLLTAACIIGTALCSFASTGIVTTDTLRLRKDASTNASIIALLSMNDKVEILEEKNGWYKVIAGEKEGYVSADYIKVLEETITPEETEAEEETNNTEEEKVENEENSEEVENTENIETTENAESEENTENKEEKVMVKALPAETKIYITPVINSLVTNTLEVESKVEVSSEVNGWSYITSGNIKGWVRTEIIVEKDEEEVEENSSQKIGYISATSINFREEANTSSNIITSLTKNTQVRVLRVEDGWAKIEYNGTKGYVSNKYISDKKVETTSRSAVNRTVKAKTTTNTDSGTDTASQGNATGSEIVAYAKKYLGYKYVYGGSTPSGFDCSGFTSYVFGHFGYSLSRTSSAQASNGKAISKSDLKVGDLICFARSSGSKTVGHVGIYIGGGQFIHAANSRKGVIISNVDGAGFYYVCARRIV